MCVCVLPLSIYIYICMYVYLKLNPARFVLLFSGTLPEEAFE